MVDRMDILDENGVDKMLEETFQTIEDNYIRRTEFEDIVDELVQRLNDIQASLV